ncbi:MAG: hypothetical protein GC159_18120 [Phycisphaera sp.]|nr:hypothetical protein [Phycisphaera sp.]
MTRWIMILGCAACLGLAGCETMEHEQIITLDAAPPAVQATITSEAKGGEIKEVAKEMRDGKTVYTADVVMGGKMYDLDITEDGKLIGKKEEKY